MDISGGILASLGAGHPCRHDEDPYFIFDMWRERSPQFTASVDTVPAIAILSPKNLSPIANAIVKKVQVRS
jgi:hypothetical protein